MQQTSQLFAVFREGGTQTAAHKKRECWEHQRSIAAASKSEHQSSCHQLNPITAWDDDCACCLFLLMQAGPTQPEQQQRSNSVTSTMPGTGQLLLLLLGLGVLFGPDLYKAAGQLGTAAEEQELDVDQGRSLGGKVHIAFCTS
jgi:hypothetical protein